VQVTAIFLTCEKEKNIIKKKNTKKHKTNFEGTFSVIASKFVSNLKWQMPHPKGIYTAKMACLYSDITKL